jgi:hypothetical protein
MRPLSGQIFLAILGISFLTGSSAFAETVPVVAVNREIGLSITGSFQDALSSMTISRSGTEYMGGGRTRPYEDIWSDKSQRIGWTPGFRADSSVMFNAFGISNLYASAQFGLQDGQRNNKYRLASPNRGSSPYTFRFGGNEDAKATSTRGEIGKGFLLLSQSLLLTPFAQGGYLSTGYDSFGDFGNFFVGAGLKADYALTSRLVLRGRFGWAEVLKSHTGFDYGQTSSTHSLWQGGLGADYRMTRHLHLTAGGDYSYTHRAQADGSNASPSSSGGFYSFGSPTRFRSYSSSLSNDLTLHAGLAYQF